MKSIFWSIRGNTIKSRPLLTAETTASARSSVAKTKVARSLNDIFDQNGLRMERVRVEDELPQRQAPEPTVPEPPVTSRSLRARSASPRAKDASHTSDVREPKGDQPTELIFKLERRGDGWGEEIIPHLTVERRPLRSKRKKSKANFAAVQETDASTEEIEEDVGQGTDELMTYLRGLGIPYEELDQLIATAVAWHETPGGKKLKDRRRLSRLYRNVRLVADYLQRECRVAWPDGIASVFRCVPELMLCKPTSNDRWDRRAVELAAFRLQYGHCNVPEYWEENDELSFWVKRQRVNRASGLLSEERLKILKRMGFEFGDVAQITEEWETRFDQLIDWMLWHGENGQPFSWVGFDWGARGGSTARELALWIALQREFRRRQLLDQDVLQRFEALQVDWNPRDDFGPAALEWMGWLGKLVYTVETRILNERGPAAVAEKARRELAESRESSSTNNGVVTSTTTGSSSSGRRARVNSGSGINNPAVLTASMISRRKALAMGPLEEEPGLGFWVAKQRWLWRQGRLQAEQVRLLYSAGVDMDTYAPVEWQLAAHAAAARVQGSKITLRLVHQVATAAATEPQEEAQEAELLQDTVQHSYSGGMHPLRVTRWVQTQRTLFAEGRLSAAQLRYLAFLGLSWVLSDEVVLMQERIWESRYKSLQTLLQRGAALEDAGLLEWLNHQRGLRVLGLLAADRRAALCRLGVSWEFDRPGDADEWDLRMSQLLIESLETGAVPPNLLPENERFAGLATWLETQQKELQAGHMSPSRQAQLKALGAF